MLRCSDQSYYVGSTSYSEVGVRIREHNDGKYVGYTFHRRPVILVWSKWFEDLSDAHQTERRPKGWSRAKKQALIRQDVDKLRNLSKRRMGKPKTQTRSSKREMLGQFYSIGIRHPEVRAEAQRRRAPKDD